MGHEGTACRPVPMCLAGGNVHDIAHAQLLGLLALGADQPCPHRDGQDLASLVPVPECAGAGCEADVVPHTVAGREDGVHEHLACERLGRLLGSRVRFVGGADELHGR